MRQISANTFRQVFILLLMFLALLLQGVDAAPRSFEQAKIQAKQQVYLDRTHSELGTLYCGCDWRWTGRSGGRVDLDSCGYEIRKNEVRANRIEWEHIVPAWTFGHQRQCWQNGGRKNCKATDEVFNIMEADLHNLSPVIGEVNADRSNYNYGMVSKNLPNLYGQCRTRTDFKQRTTEPRDEIKGLVARVTFYMFDRYALNMSRQQQQVLMAWDKAFPVTEWELERDRRIAQVMGHSNPFVIGERRWQLGHKPSSDGLKALAPNHRLKALTMDAHKSQQLKTRSSKTQQA